MSLKRHDPLTALGASVTPPTPRASDAPGAPVSAKSEAESKRSPSADDGAMTRADVPPVAKVSTVAPLARSGSASPSQFAAVAKESSAPPPSHVAEASLAAAGPDHASASASAIRTTVSPGSNAAEVSLPKNAPDTLS